MTSIMKLVSGTLRIWLTKSRIPEFIFLPILPPSVVLANCLTSQNTDCTFLAGSAAWDLPLLPDYILNIYNTSMLADPSLNQPGVRGGGGTHHLTSPIHVHRAPRYLWIKRPYTHTHRSNKSLTYKIATCCLPMIYIPFCLNILFIKS